MIRLKVKALASLSDSLFIHFYLFTCDVVVQILQLSIRCPQAALVPPLLNAFFLTLFATLMILCEKYSYYEKKSHGFFLFSLIL